MINYIVGDGRDVIAKLADGSVDLVASSPPFFALRSYLEDHSDSKHNEMGGSELTPADYLDNLLEVTALWARVLAPHGSIAIELGDTYAGSGGAGGDYNEGGMRDGQAAFDGSAARGRRKDHVESGRLPRQRVKPKQASRTGAVSADAAPPDRLRTRRQLPGFAQAKSMMLIPQLYAIALAYGINPLTGKKSPAGSWLVRNVIVWHRPNPAVGALGDKVRPSTSYIVVATKSDKRWYDLTAVRHPHSEDLARFAGKSDARDVARAAVGLSSGNGFTSGNAAGAPPLDCWFDEWDGTDDTWTLTTTPSQLAHHAMWPAKLAERIVLMMCPPEVCTVCGEPRRRIEQQNHVRAKGGYSGRRRDASEPDGNARGIFDGSPTRTSSPITLGWTECSCEDIERLATPDEVDNGCELGVAYDSRYRPGLVLDPFCGTGTTLCVAELHGRDSIGIDLDPRNRLLLEPRMAEVKRSLHGVKPEMPGQLSLI